MALICHDHTGLGKLTKTLDSIYNPLNEASVFLAEQIPPFFFGWIFSLCLSYSTESLVTEPTLQPFQYVAGLASYTGKE